MSKITSRSLVSTRSSISLAAFAFSLVGAAFWSAISLDIKVHTTALYALSVVYCLVFVGTLVHLIYDGSSYTSLRSTSEVIAGKVANWHRSAYKLLICLVIIEHCLFFTSLPVVVYHSLGLSLSDCLLKRKCTGSSFGSWVTVSSQGHTRRQEYQSVPVSVAFSNGVLAVFVGYLTVLGTALILDAIYVYTESIRTNPLKAPKGPRDIALFRNRQRLVYGMGGASLLVLVFSIVGQSVLRANWFVFSIALSLVSAYPLWMLSSSLSKEPTITRFQLRKIAQICVGLLFLWLYAAGAGVSTSLLSPLRLTTDEGAPVLDSPSIGQLVLLLVCHLGFSISAAIGIYVHLSITDVVRSLVKTKEPFSQHQAEPPAAEAQSIPKSQDEDVATVVMGETESVRQPSVLSWHMRQCASCSTRYPNTVLVPCGHSVICSDCSKALMTIPGFRCPICTVPVYDFHIDEATPRVV